MRGDGSLPLIGRRMRSHSARLINLLKGISLNLARLAVVLALCAHATAAQSSHTPAAGTSGSPCALSRPATDEPPCSPYTVVQPRLIATFPRNAFTATYRLGTLRTLADGSAVVEEAPYALFRIYGNRVGVMWAPAGSRYYPPTANIWLSRPGASPGNYYTAQHTHVWINQSPPPPTPPSHYYFYLLGAFDNTTVIQYGDDWIYGIGVDGSAKFRFSRAGTELMDQPSFLGRDPEGTLWFCSGNERLKHDTVYAFYPATKRVVALTDAVQNVFQGPSGFIYATLDNNLVEIRSVPKVRARYYRGPIPLKAGDLYGATNIAASRIGPDGSAWASTPNFVIHQQPNGQVRVIRLVRTPLTISHIPAPLSINLASDGSDWIPGGTTVRITKDDRVEVIKGYRWDYESDLRFSPDATAWLKTADDDRALLHIASPRAP